MKNKSIMLKKLCATLTAACFTLTIVGNNLFASVNVKPIEAQKQYFDLKDNANLDTLVSNKYGKVLSCKNNASDTVVINIQDLHCDYFVQKNISSLIEELSKKYKIEDVYVEGGIGKIDTSLLSNIDQQFKQNILEGLLKSGKLTGTEYYSAVSGKTNLLKGVEEKDIYLDNILRLTDIIDSKDEVYTHLSKVDQEIDFLKAKYLKSENKQFDNFLKQKENKNITQEQFLSKLFSYAQKNNISLKNYKNLQAYLSLFGDSVNNKKVQQELLSMLNEIKKTLPYDKYNQFISYTSNLTDTQNLRLFVEKFCDENNISLSKVHPNLDKFFSLQKQYMQCNPVELVKEERSLIDGIRTSLSNNQTELEIAYLSDFEPFYKGYLSAALTSSQWEYVKLGLDKFKEIYAKYSISNDVEKINEYAEELNLFYDTNNKRNEIFVSKMNLNKNTLKDSSKDENISDILSKAKRIVILVAGGYHTDGINEILNQKGITNITITPNIAKSTQKSRIDYEYLAQQQASSIRQMIALGLISNATQKEQISTIVTSLFEGQKLDGININILVEQLNRVFHDTVKVSLSEDSNQIEMYFTDGTKQVLDIEDDIAKIANEQKNIDISSSKLVRLDGRKLKRITKKVLKSAFNTNQNLFNPQIYQISKDVCLFMVNHKWYLGNGAVWEIANSEYNGQTLDGVEPIIYEYMPDFMQKALVSKQKGINWLNRLKKSKRIATRVGSFLLAVALMLSLSGCKQEEPITEPPTITPTSAAQLLEYTSEYEEVMSMFESENGYYAYLPSYMTEEEIAQWSNGDFYYVKELVNTFDQAQASIVFLKMGDTEKARQCLLTLIDKNCVEYSIRRSSGRTEYLYRIYKSNKEGSEILGEIVWTGLAAVQYKLATGSDEFDQLIKSVDEYLKNREYSDGAGFYMGSSNMYTSNGGYSSSEHQLDIMAYLTLKSLLPDEEWETIIPEYIASTVLSYGEPFSEATEEQIAEMVEKAKNVNATRLFNASKAFKIHMYRITGVVRGYNDYFLALDPNSWGIQVLVLMQQYNPTIKIEENGVIVEKSIYEESGLSDINLNSMLSNIEAQFYVTDEELKQNLSTEDYEKFKGYHLYTWSNEKFVDGKLNWSFEWSMQVATAYYLMGDFVQAQTILNDAKKFAQAQGLPDGVLPGSNVNAVLNYSSYGWKIPSAPSFAATITSILLDYGLNKAEPAYSSPFFPIEVEDDNLPSSILPSSIQKINELISLGKVSIAKALHIILNNETVTSLFDPVEFINNHSEIKGALALIITTFSALFLSFVTLYLLGFSIFIFAPCSVLMAVLVNVGTHVVIDYRYLKSVGLMESVNLYGKDKVKLTEDGLSVDKGNEFIQIYVINDKPKNAKDFNFKSVPIRMKTSAGKRVKCWLGNYNGSPILFAEGVNYEKIVEEFNKTEQFESVYRGKTVLKASVDVIEIDTNNPNRSLGYSETGNIIIGANVVKTGDNIDLQKEISLLNNKKIEAVTINQNIAIYIDDAADTISTSQDFVNIIDSYFKNENLGVDAKILFSNEYIDRVLELLETEQGSKELAQQKFIEIIKQLKDKNKDIIVIFDEYSSNTNFNKYQDYGIFSYIAGNEYVDGITSTKTQAKFVTNLNQIACFDGSLSIVKVSVFRKEIEQSSGIFTFLTSSLNLKDYMKKRSVNFVKQVASNFDYNQIPNIDIEAVAEILKSENKFEDLKKYLKENDSISVYYLGLSGEEERTVFINAILERILVANYLRFFDTEEFCFGLKNKKMETILAAALVAKYNKDGNFKVSSQVEMNENLTASQFELEFEKMIMDKVATGFKNELSEINDPQSIDDIIKLIPLYAERNVELRTANVKVMEIQDIKGILSAA